MAENNSETTNTSSKLKYFRTRIAGLSVQVAPSPTDEEKESGIVAPPTVRFEAFEERYQGDKVTVGYLATDNQVAIKVLAKDPNVDSISQKEYDEATDEEKGARRAAV